MCQRAYREVAALHDRMQVGARGAEPASAMDVAVKPRKTLLPVPVDVVGARVTGLNGRCEKRIEQRVRRRPALEHQRPAPAAPLVRSGQAGLHALEIRQAVRVVPGLHARVGGPALVVERVAALEDHAVDAARTAEHLAARMRDAPPLHVRLRFACVAPVVPGVTDRHRERARHVYQRVPDEIRATGLEDEDRRCRIGAQPIRERGSCRAAPDDDEIVVASGHRRATPSYSRVGITRVALPGASAPPARGAGRRPRTLVPS